MIAPGLAFVAAVLAVAGLGMLLGQRPRDGTRPSAARRIAALIPARLRPPLDLAARIEAAGSPGGLGAGEVMAFKVGAALAAAPVGTVFGSVVPGRLGLLLT